MGGLPQITSFTPHEYEVFVTGTRDERFWALDYRQYESGLRCECCGADREQEPPWKRDDCYGLCPTCNKSLIKQVDGSYPWSFKNHRETRNRDFFLEDLEPLENERR